MSFTSECTELAKSFGFIRPISSNNTDLTCSTNTRTRSLEIHVRSKNPKLCKFKQDAQLSQRDRAAECITVFAKSRRLELGDNILRTL